MSSVLIKLRTLHFLSQCKPVFPVGPLDVQVPGLNRAHFVQGRHWLPGGAHPSLGVWLFCFALGSHIAQTGLELIK